MDGHSGDELADRAWAEFADAGNADQRRADDDHHGHSHGHAHDVGSWQEWLGRPVLKYILLALGAALLATLVGIVAFWPDGSGRDAAVERAREVGLASLRLEAIVLSTTDGLCSFASADDPQDCRSITVELLEGDEAGAVVALPELSLRREGFAPTVAVGDRIVVGFEPATNFYFFADHVRTTSMLWLAGLFALVVIALGRVRGLLALVSMAITVAILVGFVAPSVLDGNDPLLVSVVAAAAIAFVTLYLSHGFSPTTTMALAGTLAALGLTLFISWVFFNVAKFSGFASEEALTLPIVAGEIDITGLLLGGAVLGALGALDDVTITQVATVAELRRRNPLLPMRELVVSGIRVGREHIASTVNTLLLAYAGASMPLFLLFAVSEQSLGSIANSEVVAVEIVRTLCGSIGLVAAVPLTTLLTATLLGRGGGADSAVE